MLVKIWIYQILPNMNILLKLENNTYFLHRNICYGIFLHLITFMAELTGY
jgi:hypothetical protein